MPLALVEGGFLERDGQAKDSGDRVPDLVAHVCEEFGLRLVRLLKLRGLLLDKDLQARVLAFQEREPPLERSEDAAGKDRHEEDDGRSGAVPRGKDREAPAGGRTHHPRFVHDADRQLVTPVAESGEAEVGVVGGGRPVAAFP